MLHMLYVGSCHIRKQQMKVLRKSLPSFLMEFAYSFLDLLSQGWRQALHSNTLSCQPGGQSTSAERLGTHCGGPNANVRWHPGLLGRAQVESLFNHPPW